MAKKNVTEHKHGGLGQLAATAICGNDITSSCLYVSALAIYYSGKWAPVALLIVAGVLFLFRSIYAEVVGALPLNGGAYNALLNTTSKFRASVAACLTILSYMATAVISASEAMHYVHALLPTLPVILATIGLLGGFMVLSIIGITESARVAILIFVTHIVTLTILMVAGGLSILSEGTDILTANLTTPTEGGLAKALLFGFAASLLGISGFESSANFVEEQAENIFPKTLRNMWVSVSIFNPGIAILALALVPMTIIHEHQEALLTHMGHLSGGTWLAGLISVDAALVLSGAVLTSFVGVNGLVRRMTLDRCLPQFLLKQNPRRTTHRIIITFFLLCVSILLITEGDLKKLAGVYTISFLAVMILFGFGNVLLKIKRARLPRPTTASWLSVTVAIAAMLTGLVGNAMLNPDYLIVFLEYFIPTLLIVLVMLKRTAILKFCLFMVRSTAKALIKRLNGLTRFIRGKIDQINGQQIVFFTRGDNTQNLNQAMLYVQDNEETNRIKVVIVVDNDQDVPPHLENDLDFLGKVYPDMTIEFVKIKGTFGPQLVQELSAEWHIPINFMFIGSPGNHFMYGISELGGVRLII